MKLFEPTFLTFSIITFSNETFLDSVNPRVFPVEIGITCFPTPVIGNVREVKIVAVNYKNFICFQQIKHYNSDRSFLIFRSSH